MMIIVIPAAPGQRLARLSCSALDGDHRWNAQNPASERRPDACDARLDKVIGWRIDPDDPHLQPDAITLAGVIDRRAQNIAYSLWMTDDADYWQAPGGEMSTLEEIKVDFLEMTQGDWDRHQGKE